MKSAAEQLNPVVLPAVTVTSIEEKSIIDSNKSRHFFLQERKF